MNKKNYSTIKIMVILFFSIFVITGCHRIPSGDAGKIMVLSVSSNGKYVISTDTSRHAVLWNIPARTYKIIRDFPINIYSAYFVKNTNYFMYQQDDTNIVIVRDINGKPAKKIKPGFPTYGQVITTDLHNYFGARQKDIVFWSGPKGRWNLSGNLNLGFFGAGKLFNLSLSANEKYLIGSSGFGEIYLFEVKNGRLLQRIVKNNAQTFATISPDNKYIISGDVANRGLYIPINTNSYKKFFYQTPTHQNIKKYLTNGMQNSINAIVTVKFIDKDTLLAIYKGMPESFNFATLYNPKKLILFKSTGPNVWAKLQLLPIKYIPLLTPNNPDQPYPATQSFVRDQAIDAAPSAHILVMTQAHNNGILVYKYNPKTQTLKQIWAPVIKTPWWHIW